MAHLLRLGILPTGYIHPPAERTLRELARKRVQPVRSRTQHVLEVENILARSTRSRPSATAIKRLAPATSARSDSSQIEPWQGRPTSPSFPR